MNITEMNDRLFKQQMGMIAGYIKKWRVLEGVGRVELMPESASYLLGDRQNLYPLAKEIKPLWDYACGAGPRPENIEETIDKIICLLWQPVGYQDAEAPQPPVDWWRNSYLALMCKAAQARNKFDSGESLTSEELALLAGLNPVRIRQLCINGTIKAEKIKVERKGARQKQEWLISNRAAADFINFKLRKEHS
jgi:hypothetical protein